LLRSGPRCGAQIAVVLIEHRAQGIAAVAQQMESIRHLDGVRGVPGGSLGIGAGAVTDHGGHPGMRRQLIRALESEQDDRAKVNGLFGSLNDWKG
jgi:hypothetical protein